MTETIRQSRVRDSRGPKAVDSPCNREKARSGSGTQSSKRASQRSSRAAEHSHRRKLSYSQAADSLELNVIGQPTRHIALGATVETSVLLRLMLPSAERAPAAVSIDTSRLFAVATLVADTKTGDHMPMEAGTMTGQKTFDSVHPIPDECAESLGRNQSCHLALGYFSFPGLLIRQPGNYHVRVTLINMAPSGQGTGGASVTMVDTELIKVEKRITSVRRGHRHACN